MRHARSAASSDLRGVEHVVTQGFGAAADAYERGRPDYPAALLEYLKHTVGIKPGWRVLDVGAGTGKFTRMLERTGARVIAVEPVAAMRAVCAAELPDTTVIGATAGALPFRSESQRAVVAAQAFHWFASPEAVAELRRVLGDDGVLVLVWNVRDERVPWVRELTTLLNPYEGNVPRYKNGGWKGVLEASCQFGSLWQASFEHAQVGPVQAIEDRVASISYVAALPEADRAQLLERVRSLAAANRGEDGRVVLPYRTEVYWTAVRSRQPNKWGRGCDIPGSACRPRGGQW